MWPWWKKRKSFWTTTTTMTSRKRYNSFTFVLLMLIQLFVPSSSIVGKKCKPRFLLSCDENEMCVIGGKDEDSVCECREGFIENPDTSKCEKPKPTPEPPNSHLALGLGLALTFFLLFVMVTLIALHYKFGLLSGMCDRLPRIRLFGTGGRDVHLVDNEDDDVNPIV